MSLREKAEDKIIKDAGRYLDERARLLVRARRFVPAIDQGTMTVEEFENVMDAVSAASAYQAVFAGMMREMEFIKFDENLLDAFRYRSSAMDDELGEIGLTASNLAFDFGWIGMGSDFMD